MSACSAPLNPTRLETIQDMERVRDVMSHLHRDTFSDQAAREWRSAPLRLSEVCPPSFLHFLTSHLLWPFHRMVSLSIVTLEWWMGLSNPRSKQPLGTRLVVW
jgi:hypothetical protein